MQAEATFTRRSRSASACIAWESSASRLDRDENSHVQPNQKYALTTARILVHYMINGGFLGAGGTANRDNNYILDHVAPTCPPGPVSVSHSTGISWATMPEAEKSSIF